MTLRRPAPAVGRHDAFVVDGGAAIVETVTVDIATADDTAISPADYTAIPTTTLTFPPGLITQPVTVTVEPDMERLRHPTQDVQITWLLHASFLIQFGDRFQVLVDPVLEEIDGSAGRLMKYADTFKLHARTPLTVEELPGFGQPTDTGGGRRLKNELPTFVDKSGCPKVKVIIYM